MKNRQLEDYSVVERKFGMGYAELIPFEPGKISSNSTGALYTFA